MVSQQAATKSTSYSDSITLVAEAIKGDAATVNTWVADTKANDTELVFVGEGETCLPIDAYFMYSI